MFDLRDLQIALLKPAREVDMSSGWTEHVPFAFFITRIHRPRVLVELGTHTGTSFCAFCQAVQSLNLPTRCFAVDTWKGDTHAGFYGNEVFAELSSYHNSLYSSFSSLLPMTFDEALKEFADGTIDLLHIDGCHFYNAVAHDFESWAPKMSPRGVVLLHDTYVEGNEFGVGRFFEELHSRYPTFEFTHGHGLGVVGVGGELAGEPVWQILQAAPEVQSDLKLFFSTVGRKCLNDAKVEGLEADLAARDEQITQLEKVEGIGLAVSKVIRKAKHGFRAVERIYNLRHYSLLKGSDLFDADWYSKGPHSYLGKKIPLVHYLISGAPRGKNPSLRFSNEKYLESHPDVRESGINPLAHYLLNGQKEDPQSYSSFAFPSFKKISDHLNSAPQNYPPLREAVDVIIPVFNGMQHLPALFDSIFSNTTSPHRFVIVDDASTDPEVWPYLKSRVAGRSDCVLLQNTENLGFPATVNRAACECAANFALLNSDVIVPRYWLERLMRPIFENGNVACTTPFSNSATIFSFPRHNADNPMLSSDVETVDTAFRCLRPDIGPENDAPTGVGFCMGINGNLWRRIGGFDQDAFGRGYGEENDWCQRAISHGYRNVLVQDLFVAHYHGGSFDPKTTRSMAAKNIEIIKERWPNYLPSVQGHVRGDKWTYFRHAAFLALCLSQSSRPLVIIDADLRGGANLYSDGLVQKALAEERSVITLRYDRRYQRIKVEAAFGDFVIEFHLVHEDEISTMLATARGATVLVNELVSWRSPESVLGIITKLKAAIGAGLELAVHDFFSVCPSIYLRDENGDYCRLPSESVCRKCLPKNRHSFGKRGDIDQWRDSWRIFLRSVDKVSFFSKSSFELINRIYPEISEKSEISPHEPLITFPPGAYRVRQGHPLTIGVVGHIVRHKGGEIVQDLARLLVERKSKARIVVVGELEPECNEKNAIATGAYRRKDLPGLLNYHKVNVVLFPSIVPETFSYVTQEIISLGCPIVCFDLGAQAEQVRKYKLGRIASAMTAESALLAIEELMTQIATPRPCEGKP